MRHPDAPKPATECRYPRGTKNAALNRLFKRWLRQYPRRTHEFHRDGIVDEKQFRKSRPRVLFVLLEPNSKGGRFDRNQGCDLRGIFRDMPLKKSLDRNLARWTRLLLDGQGHSDWRPSQKETKTQLRRVAIINLKKLAGGGRANSEAIGILAWQDRKFLRKQIRIIAPHVIVACGLPATKVLTWVLRNDLHVEIEERNHWRFGRIPVLPGNHPSVRPADAPAAFRKLRRLARRAGLKTHGA